MRKDIRIRPIRESDIPSVRAVALEAWRFTYRNIFDGQFIERFVNQNYAPEALILLFPRLQSGTMYFNIAKHGSKVVGYCNIGIDGQTAELYRIYLLPDYIGQGIGQGLLKPGEKFLLEHGIHAYFCFVHKDNDIGKRFYSRSGFHHIPEKDQDDEWYMEKRLIFPESETPFHAAV